MSNLVLDLPYAFRVLLRSPGFSVAIVLVLALGIGANTLIFSVVDAVLLRPLPYQDSSRIMQIWHVSPAKSFPGMSLFTVSRQSRLSACNAHPAYSGPRFNRCRCRGQIGCSAD